MKIFGMISALILSAFTGQAGMVILTVPTPVIYGNGKVLFVIDDSGSMGIHQSNLANAAGELSKMRFAEAAVITTSTTRKFPMQITKIDDPMLRSYLMPGVDGDAQERPFEAIQNAITGSHADFFSQESLLIVLVTDAEDQGALTANQVTQVLLEKVRNFEVVAAIVPSGSDPKCQRDDTVLPVIIEDFVHVNKGVIVDICSENLGQQIVEKATEMTLGWKPGIQGNEIVLSAPAEESTLVVYYGTQTLSANDPKFGYVYENDKNTIVFGSDIKWGEAQPLDAKITIRYLEK